MVCTVRRTRWQDARPRARAEASIDSSKISVLCCTSAVPIHPSTIILDETLDGIRYHLPQAQIILLADGVWSGIAHRAEQYAEYLAAVEKKYPEIRIVRFPQHTQQTAMAQYAIQNFVQTKLVFWQEHDGPLLQKPIDWDEIVRQVESHEAGLIRFSIFEQGIHEAHEHLMRGRYQVNGNTYVKTVQFSGWSFLTTVQYFVSKIFSGQPIGREMLELRQYERVVHAPWEEYKNVIYLPKEYPHNCMRHSNGRGYGVEERDPCDWGSE